MNVKLNSIVSISEANQNFSKIARLVDKTGEVIVFKNNKPKYKLIDIENNSYIEMTDDEKNAISHRARALHELLRRIG